MHRSSLLSLIVMIMLTGYGHAQNTEELPMSQTDAREELLKKIAMYRNSVIHADDLKTAEHVWALTPEASFTHPQGHESGWRQIKENFYGKTMAGTFSKRELKLTSMPVIRIYGDAAVVEFTWDFTATQRKDGTERHTTGRESQFFVKQPELGWRLVHVHYSGPATAPK